MNTSSIDSVAPRTSKPKGKFTPEEDRLLLSYVGDSEVIDWTNVANRMGNKTTRQCRERWQNYLDPRLQKGGWTPEEDELLLARYSEYSSHWNAIARTFKGRSGNSVRNRYLLLIRRREKKNRSNAAKIPTPSSPSTNIEACSDSLPSTVSFAFESNSRSTLTNFNIFDDMFDGAMFSEIDTFGYNLF